MSEDNNTPQNKDSGKASDRREYRRVELVTDFKYDVIPMHYPGESGLIQNISEGGLCILLDREFPRGTVLHIEFSLPPDNDHVEALVKVVWQQPIEGQFITGVKFMH